MLGPALTLGSYLLGSISPGLWMARQRGVDLRREGSGNTGATNVGRLLGREAGRRVLVLDALKGALPAAVARLALGPDDPWASAAAAAAVVGHCYPLFHGFAGGKGAATAAGAMLVLAPPAGLAAAGTYLVVKRWTRRASLGSIAGALAGATAAHAVLGPSSPRAWAASAIAALVVLRHADNLRRLARGEEPPS